MEDVGQFDLFKFCSCSIYIRLDLMTNKFCNYCFVARVFTLWEISMSSALIGTSSTSAIFRIASSVELYALSGIPWNSREFFLVYCSKRFEDRKAQLFLPVDRLFVSSPRQAPSPQLQAVSWI